MAEPLSVDTDGVRSLSEIHTAVATGLGSLTAASPGSAAVAVSHGTIAYAVETALTAALGSRSGTMTTTQSSGSRISELLQQAAQAYERGDQRGGQAIRAAADAITRGEAPSGGGTPGAAGTPGGGAVGSAGSDGVGQAVGQLGQQLGQLGQLGQQLGAPLAAMAQPLQQLPQQVMQGVQQAVQSGAQSGAEPDVAAERAEAADRAEPGDPPADGADAGTEPTAGTAPVRADQVPGSGPPESPSR